MRWWIAFLALTALSCGSPAAPSAPFTGRWSGTYLVTQCTPSGWSSCTGSASIAPRPGEIWTADYDAQLVNVVPQP